MLRVPYVGTILQELKRHSKESYEHSVRVWGLARRFSRYLDWPPSERDRFVLAAPIHDAGKLFVEHAILEKPGQLTDEEWLSIRNHSTLGSDYLSALGVPEHLCEIVACHHERIDGNGYPSGLRDIPHEARALAICDTVDAMCSTRCYHKKESADTCLQELHCCAGKQLDKELVLLFSNHWDEITQSPWEASRRHIV